MRRTLVRALGWVAGRTPTVLVWTGLAGLFAYGAANGWKFGPPAAPEKGTPAAPGTPAAGEPFTPYLLDRPFDVPIEVTHDPKHCTVGDRPVRLASPEAADLAGIATTRAAYQPVAVAVEAHGEVQADPLATARVAPRVGGVLVALEKDVGDPVRKGELLALVDSLEVGRAKTAYLTARVQLEARQQKRAVLSPGVTPQPAIVEADAAVREARAALYSARQAVANLGLPLPAADDEALPDEAFTRRLHLLGVPLGKRLELLARAETGEPPTANLLPVFSPLDGVVTKRAGVVGEPVAALHPVYEVGDPARVFVALDVRQEDMPRVAVGQAVAFRVEGGATGPAAAGSIDWVSSVVDDKTRTVRVRARVPNPGGGLRAGAFGRGTVTVEPPRPALVVPREAVHWEGCSHVVFVKKSAAEWLPRKVGLGVRTGGVVEVVAGLAAGDEVAVAGSHVLKNELLKARIGDAEE